MSEWNFDMSKAPKDEVVSVSRIVGKNEVQVEQHVPVVIFAAGADGKTVTPTKWLHREGRWSMFTKDVPPVAWMYWPSHPGTP